MALDVVADLFTSLDFVVRTTDKPWEIRSINNDVL